MSTWKNYVMITDGTRKEIVHTKRTVTKLEDSLSATERWLRLASDEFCLCTECTRDVARNLEDGRIA